MGFTKAVRRIDDPAFAALAQPGERLHAIHRSALLERKEAGAGSGQPVSGSLFLSSQRLLHAGPSLLAIPLDQIAETMVAVQRLVLIRLRDGGDLAVEVTQPHLLKVQLEAAQAS